MSDPAEYGADVASALPAYLAGIVRQLATVIGTSLAARGVLAADGSQTELFVGVAVIVASAAWGVFTRWRTRKALQDAIAAPAGRAK